MKKIELLGTEVEERKNNSSNTFSFICKGQAQEWNIPAVQLVAEVIMVVTFLEVFQKLQRSRCFSESGNGSGNGIKTKTDMKAGRLLSAGDGICSCKEKTRL